MVLGITFLCLCLVISFTFLILPSSRVNAAPEEEGTTTVTSGGSWNSGGFVNITTAGYADNEIVVVSFFLMSQVDGYRVNGENEGLRFVEDRYISGSATVNDSACSASVSNDGRITVRINPSGWAHNNNNPNNPLQVGYSGSGLDKTVPNQVNVSVEVIDPTPIPPQPSATNSPTPTPKPTAPNTPTPKPEATSTPKPTATPKPAATNTPKPTATPKPAAATATPKPAATTAAPVPATATPAPNDPDTPVAPVETQPGETQPAADTPTNIPTPTPETSETPTPTPETEETEPTVIAPVIHEDEPDATDSEPTEEDGDPTNTPTPTTKAAVAATTSKKSNNFPWWIIFVAIIVLVGGRYFYLRNHKGYYRKDALIDLIPGGLVRKAAGLPPARSAAATVATAGAPNVVNGYLQTSNTKSIRPVYSNTPAARAAEAKAEAAGSSAGSAPALKAPIKRPASASVNHAAAAAAATTATATAKPAADTKAVPPTPRPPIKRPASASVNHAAATTAKPAADTKAVPPTPKPPIKRPASASVNHAAAATAAKTAEDKKAAAPTPKPPIKRPASASVNHAAAAAAAGGISKMNSTPTSDPKPEAAVNEAEQKSPFHHRSPMTRTSAVPAGKSVAEVVEERAAAAAAAAAANNSEGKASPFSRSPFNRPAAGADEQNKAPSGTEEKLPLQQRPPIKRPAKFSANRNIAQAAIEEEKAAAAAGRAATPGRPGGGSSPRSARTAEKEDTMNRPDSSALNANASHTAAQEAFIKQQSEQKLAPAIATGFVPPVIDKEEHDDRPSPFKPVAQPIVDRAVDVEEKKEEVKPEVKRPSAGPHKYVPPIAQFTPGPVKKEEASPFKPLNNEEETGLKAPIKRPASASVNRAAAMQAEADKNKSALDRIQAAKTATISAGATDIDAKKAEEEAKKAAEEAARKSSVTRPGARPGTTAAKTFKPAYDVPERPAPTSPFKPNPAAASSNSNRPFNAAAAMKEIRAMEESDDSSAEQARSSSSGKGKRGGLGGLFHRW